MKLTTTICFAALFLVAASAGLAQPPAAITGDYLEVRSNHVYTCGCVQSGEMVTSGRQAILAWNIRSGEFEGVQLKGLKAVAVLVGDHNIGFRNVARRSVLYLDGTSSADQERALLALLRSRYGELLGQTVETRRTEIIFESGAAMTRLRIPDTLRVVARSSRLPDDAHAGSSLWYDPLIELARSDITTVVHDEYHGDVLRQMWRRADAGITGFRGEFALN